MFCSQTTLEAIFARIFRDFSRIFDKSKLWGCACTPASHTTAFNYSMYGIMHHNTATYLSAAKPHCYALQHVLSDVWVIKSSELGMHDDFKHARTHLGHLLKVGDTVMGLDLRNSNVSNDHLEKMRDADLPDVVRGCEAQFLFEKVVDETNQSRNENQVPGKRHV